MKTVFRLLSSVGRALARMFPGATATSPWFARLLAIVLLCGGGVAAPAQLPPRDPAKVQAQAVRRQAADAARDLAARGDLAGAEQALRAVNYIQANTAAGHFETAQRLTQLAATLSRAGNAAGARAAALRALAVLEQADRLPRDTHLQAGIRRQIAFLQERYLGNPAAAKAAHRAAAALVPDHPSAREKVQQLDQAEANARSRAAAAPDRTAAPVRGAPRSPGRTTDLP